MAPTLKLPRLKVKIPTQNKLKRELLKKKNQGQIQSAPSHPQESMPVYGYAKDTDIWDREDVELSPSKKKRRLGSASEEEETAGVTAMELPDPFAESFAESSKDAQQREAKGLNWGVLGDEQPEVGVEQLPLGGNNPEWVDEVGQEPMKVGKWAQGASVKMAPLLERLQDIQDTYISQNYQPGMVCCEKCIVSSHTCKPKHRVEKWNGHFFNDTPLSTLGVGVYLGHHGEPCPEADPTNLKKITLVHTNGIHCILVNYCYCPGHPSYFRQLLDCRFFPGTVEHPQTVFSFEVLSDFHPHTLTSKKAVYDYYDAIRRKTDPVLLHETKSLYQSFLRCARIHCHLSSKQQAGQSHGIDSHVPHRRPGCATIHCPTCVEPHHNIDAKEIIEAKPEERHKYTRFFAIDGCHSAQRLRKLDDPDDVALNTGSAYFVERLAFRVYASKQTGEANGSTHAEYPEVQERNSDRDCGNGLHMPWALLPIWNCRYGQRQRNNTEFFNNEELLKLLEGVVGAVPQAHIDGHNDDCKAKYHYAYTMFVAMTIGEIIETPCAAEKLTGGMTQHMNDGHRHDTLNDFHNFWNWCKVQLMGLSLKQKWAKAVHAIEDREPVLEELTKSYDKKVIAEWLAWYAKPLPDIPSFKSRINEQMTQERVRVSSKQGFDGLTDLLVTGIKLDMKRAKLKHLASLKKPSKEQKKKLDAARSRFHKDAVAFGEMIASYYPTLVTLLQSQAKEVDVKQPEQHPLPLPSSFSGHECNSIGLDEAASIERSL
ncbi:hypothetical protein V5O48_014831 [Marasmius crinis-equi]|uniref:CxC2-like cysteine cluster KDZ transposase-associated domain-containing protein n=1 Tax=Marasmius crinis-equi TaxID=585013 RepID=A0ABR3EWJ1_9AGAR